MSVEETGSPIFAILCTMSLDVQPPFYPSVRVVDPRKGGAKGGFVLIAVSPLLCRNVLGACSFHELSVALLVERR